MKVLTSLNFIRKIRKKRITATTKKNNCGLCGFNFEDKLKLIFSEPVAYTF